MYEETSLKKIGQKQFLRLSFIEGQGRKIYSAVSAESLQMGDTSENSRVIIKYYL